MIKLPKFVGVVIFILIIVLLFFILTLIRTIFVKNTGTGYELVFSEIQFYVSFGFCVILAFLAGVFYLYPYKSWTSENFIKRMNSTIEINTAIINLQRRKAELKDDADMIPDPIQLIISTHKIDGGKVQEKIKIVK